MCRRQEEFFDDKTFEKSRLQIYKDGASETTGLRTQIWKRNLELPRGSKYPIFKDSGPKKQLKQGWILGPETSNVGYLDPLG